jgi:hypothetical protein
VSDRLNELQRQRALVQEHLAWLDREIATESGGAQPTAASPLANQPGAPAPLQAAATPRPSSLTANPAQTEAVAQEILAKYKVEPQSLQSNVKRGCFMYFFLAFLLVGLATLGLFLYSARR